MKWSRYSEPVAALALGADGTLYVAAEKRVYALSQCPEERCPEALRAFQPSIESLSRRPKDRRPARRQLHPNHPPRSASSTKATTCTPDCRPGTTAIVRGEGDGESRSKKVP